MDKWSELERWAREESTDENFVCDSGPEHVNVEGIECVLRGTHQWYKVFREPVCEYFEAEALERNNSGIGTCNKYGGCFCPYSGIVRKEHTEH